jgi:hypothetical protein
MSTARPRTMASLVQQPILLILWLYLHCSIAFLPAGRVPTSPWARAAPSPPRFVVVGAETKPNIPTAVFGGDEDRSTPIDGLLPDDTFELYDQYDRVLLALRRHIPNLLVTPLSDANAARQLYDDQFRLLVGATGRESLVYGIDELVTISKALSIAAAATGSTSNMIFPWSTSRPTTNQTAVAGGRTVAAKLAYNPLNITNCLNVSVEWSVAIIVPLSSNADNGGSKNLLQLSGTSVLTLTPKVSIHRLLSLQLNNVTIDVAVAGDWLASIRRTIKTVQAVTPNLPIAFGNPLSFATTSSSIIPPLGGVVMPSSRQTKLAPLFCHSADNSFDSVADWVPVDQWNGSQQPIPGSNAWAEYRQQHVAVQTFQRSILPKLIDGTVDESYFVANAVLVGLDNNNGQPILIQGAARMARLYKSLALWRRRSAGSLSVTVLRAPKKSRSNDESLVAVVVRYEANTLLPGPVSSSLTMIGQDRFAHTAVVGDHSDNDIKIVSVTQEILDFGGEQARFIDSAWLTRQVIASIEMGEPMNWFAVALNPVMPRSNLAPTPTRPNTSRRSDRAALTIYRVMEALHIDVDNMFDPLEPALPPASQYVAENIILRGYLDEPILQGRSVYQQALGFPITSLRAAAQSGAVSCQISSLRTELTAAGNVQCTMTISISTSDAVRQLAGQLGPLLANNLKIELLSEYRFDESSGLVAEHLLRECRVNGALTPADVVVRFLRNRQVPGGDDWMALARESFQWPSMLGQKD